MLTRKEREDLFRTYLDIEPFEDSEMAELGSYMDAEELFDRLRLRLCGKSKEREKLMEDMLHCRGVMEMYHNIYYLRQGYLLREKENKIP